MSDFPKVTRKHIEIKGARMHNLKNIDVNIPRNALTVVTGVSGSGKSSLIFDTLYAEGQRRYVESLSSYARQFLGKLEKPEVTFIRGLSPCIAIEQKVHTHNPRSTVATSTEIYDYLKLLFARVGRTFSPVSDKEVKCHSVKDVLEFIVTFPNEATIHILIKIKATSPAELKKAIMAEMKKGFSRLMLASDEIIKIEQWLEQPNGKEKEVLLLIDRLVIDKHDEEQSARFADSVETAFWEGHGELFIKTTSEKGDGLHPFSNRFEADGISFEQPSVNFLSFNNPFGACNKCEGFGSVIGIDENLVIPNPSLSVYEGAVACWRGESMQAWQKDFILKSVMMDFPVHRAYEDLDQKEKDLLWNGHKGVKGIWQFFKFVEENSYKIQYRVMLSKYKGKTVCPDCMGTRLRKDASYVKLVTTNKPNGISDKVSLPEVLLLNIEKAFGYFSELKLNSHDQEVAERILKEITNRLEYLMKVGVGYLQLNRLSNSLSGGESQRINLATILGSSLVGSTYILDEPSIGLHSHDTEKLIEVLQNLKNTGNTVIVVEHDEEIMRAAEHIIDIGPLAGTQGGELVFEGTFDALLSSDTLTGNYLNNPDLIEVPENRRRFTHSIDLKGARLHNLKNVDTTIPLNVITTVTGVSGSGKTTLIKNVLYPILVREITDIGFIKAGSYKSLEGNVNKIERVEIIDQNPIGKSSRSNPVTYIKAYDAIREMFSNLPLSKQRGFKGAHFSFNVEGGRCDNCQGEGEEIVEMQFMADLHLLCEVCKGKRFKEEVLEANYKGKSIYDVLCLTVDEAMLFFKDAETIVSRLKPLQDVGLGYVTLGQSSSTLSGGEAQRIKLASYLGKGSAREHTLFIFDEPTTGLHFHDIKKLLTSFDELIKKGHTIVIIEHNLDVIKCADWVVDLGPGGGEKGGNIVFQGTPEALIACKESVTGQYLKGKLGRG